ncbi:MAG: IS3 family transposase [Armatimonadota bacterium]
MIAEETKQELIPAIEEAVHAGARLSEACRIVGISERTFQNWKRHGTADRRRGAEKQVVRKLSDEEREEILCVCGEPRFADLTPHEIVSILATEGRYIASVRTFYRVLKTANQLHHRSDTKPKAKSSKPPERVATAPNQVWCWDITYLATEVRGIYLYAYVIIDLYDRSIVGWRIHDREDTELARELFHDLSKRMDLHGVQLHSDNGPVMKGLSLLALLYVLGVVLSHSRPRVSDDNPFIESFFKTLKYTAGYPGRFRNIEHAREWMAAFIHWFNNTHLHSALGYVTPADRRAGRDVEIFARRNKTIEVARRSHPERWGSREPRRWIATEKVVLNPEKRENDEKKSA